MRRETQRAEMGLTSQEARKQLIRHGPNILKQTKKVKPFAIFAAQFKDVLVGILLIATVLSVVMGEISEAVTILIIVFLNALLGFIQEFRTERTLEALKKMAAPTAKVLRDGMETSIPSDEVVPEDLLLLEAGDRVAADAMLQDSVELYADESILTGESLSVKKDVRSTAFMGSIITRGRGRAKVTATGMQTEMGRIAGMIDEIAEEMTPLQKRLEQLGKYIGIGCLLICAVVAVTGILRGEKPFAMLLTGISLSVAAVPEGLPAIVTISLALAVSRMLKRNALIRKLAAVETLGCAGVICSDKTGTITENKMTVTTLITPDTTYEVTGTGYEKNGSIRSRKSSWSKQDDGLTELLEAAALCNNAHLYHGEKTGLQRLTLEGSSYSTAGEPTEIALLIAASKGGATEQSLSRQYVREAEIPFNSERKSMSVLVHPQDGRNKVIIKGAADVVIKKCAYIQKRGAVIPITEEDTRWVTAQTENMAKGALRVLGFAYKYKPNSGLTEQDEHSFIFVGLAGMIDPPRKEVYDAIRICRRAGIRPVMITGDHALTAEAIAREIKLLTYGDGVLTGAQLDRMSDEQLEKVAATTAVYARVTPQHKLRIVRALKKSGNIVAMTGDGVNDAPAIKEADIGAAMGISGTDVTKEAAAVILLDDNFATLVAAVEEGRVIYQNIRKFIRYLISCNIGEVLTMFVGMLMGLPVILLPIQILLVNLVTDGLPAIALGLEPPENDEMTRKPRPKNESIFSGGLLTTIIFRGCIIGLATLGTFVTVINHWGSIDAARSAALLTLIFSQLIHVFECKSEKKNLFQINLFSNIRLVLAVLLSAAIAAAAVYWPPLNGVFNTVALVPLQLLAVLGYSFAGPVIAWVVSLFKPKPAVLEQAEPEQDSPKLLPPSGGYETMI